VANTERWSSRSRPYDCRVAEVGPSRRKLRKVDPVLEPKELGLPRVVKGLHERRRHVDAPTTRRRTRPGRQSADGRVTAEASGPMNRPHLGSKLCKRIEQTHQHELSC